MNPEKQSNLEEFNGTVDEFLTHCSKLDAEQIENELAEQEYNECLRLVMRQNDCTEEEAEQIVMEMFEAEHAKEVVETLDSLIEEGKVETFTKDGEVLYRLTALGEQEAEKNSKK
jgi:hypothetical protein